MKLPPQYISRCGTRRLDGMTLLEMLIAIGIGSMVFAAVGMLTIYTARSFAGLANYDDLDRYSRNALDLMSREIRQTKAVVAFQTNQMRFMDSDGQTNLTYYWTPPVGNSVGILTRTKGGETRVLLTNCDFLTFAVYQRNPNSDFTFYPTNTVADAKLVSVSWKCSRKILGQTLNTESVQTAKIVIRNH